MYEADEDMRQFFLREKIREGQKRALSLIKSWEEDEKRRI